MTKNKTISLIGPNASACTQKVYEFGEVLGKYLVDSGFTLINGGMGGFMEAVFKGARLSEKYSFGKTIGIIPGLQREEANTYCDIVIPSGLSYARNQLVVAASDIIIAVAGGAGTLSEIAFAWQLAKRVLCFTQFGGWSKELAGMQLDNRKKGELIPLTEIEKLNAYL